MTISLRIDNRDRLADGGPLAYVCRDGALRIGRSDSLEWPLPDPSCTMSGTHCEIRWEAGRYVLLDLSRNGTFLNGSRQRVKSPCILSAGDRLSIGPYIVVVDSIVPGDEPESAFETPQRVAGGDMWTSAGPGPAPIDRRELVPEHRRGRRAPDFSKEFISLSPPDLDPLPVGGLAWAKGPMGGGHEDGRDDAAKPLSPRERLSIPAPERVGGPIPGAGGDDPFGFAARRERDAEAPARRGATESSEAMRRFAAGAGIDPAVLADRDAGDTAEEIGAVFVVVVGAVHQLLEARKAAKAMTKSSQRTMIGLVNNPLKQLASPQEIIEVMLAGRQGRYLGAQAAFDGAFADIKRHEIATFAAMQTALARLLDDLSPQAIEGKVTGSAFASRKARNWDMFVARWEAKCEPHENGMLDVFLNYFAQAYDETSGRS